MNNPALFVAEFEISDAEGMTPYLTQIGATLEPFGGRLVSLDHNVVSLEGDTVKGGMAVIAFDDMEKAQAWYHSAAYQAIIPIRQKAARTRAYIIDGLAQ
ncbi:DUF1330 domain-containing protein [Uruburuella testudinis]|uniref:DUF1330 domain-containing protein n=2 Tax=Pseudomonadota TaxID=1224 RepID=A0A0A3AQH3_9PAST|nr:MULTISPECIES: DUF1330 domain-containing protein [Pseudomonadota]KGQ70032.1 hypothetical protein OA57_08160 [Chelonobacter oris]UOO81083.1 DUF1330 domain-containing protein [Uruburuella testudinis]